jgi:two-component system chemotaxis response regulator CheB
MASPVDVVVIGASLGGLKALKILLGALPASFAAPVVIVQHRSKHSEEGYAQLLQEASLLPVSEIEDKDELAPGHVYLAPPDYHVLVDGKHLSLSTEDPVNHSRPSIDVLFESAAHGLREKVVAVVLTGSTADGAEGAWRVKRNGGRVVCQDPAGAESGIMPAAAIASADAEVLPLEDIGRRLVELVGA